MKIIQFTDLHIGTERQDTFGVDVRQNLSKVLAEITREAPDQVVLTGDLCFREPQVDIYHWIAQQLHDHGINPLIIPGNHDDQRMMHTVHDVTLRGQTNEVYFDTVWEGYRVLFLDTAVGHLSSQQWSWLEDHCAACDGSMIIFMHHPPAHCGVPYMDARHGFEENSRFQDILQTVRGQVHIYCGHYHVDRTVSVGNLHIHITPSCFFQINQDNPEFEVDHYRVGYRKIILGTGKVASTVVYLD